MQTKVRNNMVTLRAELLLIKRVLCIWSLICTTPVINLVSLRQPVFQSQQGFDNTDKVW